MKAILLHRNKSNQHIKKVVKIVFLTLLIIVYIHILKLSLSLSCARTCTHTHTHTRTHTHKRSYSVHKAPTFVKSMRSHGGQPYLQCFFGEIDFPTQTCDLSLLVEHNSHFINHNLVSQNLDRSRVVYN